ncbi:hypothetical protein VIN01S_25190 [Vibrio inusitatus NBRC 102082]|uniref:Uncharacterized protein n=1 Tax=Vibrio inusitatus NBRC 102082 TaxID=1219070 RepID=A0A4Y3HXF0_9VIBR|nr:hypothetical protein [Vibrio inusitatus]GEA51715.1 hypothetical protein VIN01S_25190 [Vibrio inusitatus NBRC 102082]
MKYGRASLLNMGIVHDVFLLKTAIQMTEFEKMLEEQGFDGGDKEINDSQLQA